VGALCAGLWVASRGRLEGTTRIAIFAALAQAVATVGFVATGWFPLGMLCGALIGAVASMHGISVQTLLQSAADPAYRGRMLSLWGLITRAFPALGALLLGGLGELFGLRLPTLAAAALFLGVFAWGLTKLKRIEAALEGQTASARDR
jgi:predicted MFS family arabinose efflux permease